MPPTDELSEVGDAVSAQRSPHLRVIDGGEQSESMTIAEPLPGAPEQTVVEVDGRSLVAVDGCAIPEGYELWRDGVWQIVKPESEKLGFDTMKPTVHYSLPVSMQRRRKLVFGVPLWIAAVAEREAGAKVMKLGGRGVHSDQPLVDKWVSHDSLGQARKIVGDLRPCDLPIDSGNAPGVVAYFTKLDLANRGRFVIEQTISRSGYHTLPSGSGWLLGKKWTGPGKISYDPLGENSFAAALRARGSCDRWTEKFRAVRADGTAARMALAASFAAPLVRLLGQQSFWFFLCGKSQSGKTAFVQFAMSIYGDPARLKRTFNATQNGILAPLRECTDLPLHVDEFESARKDFSLKKAVYDSCNDVERSRATKTGGVQESATWTTLIMANGEHNLIETTDLEGVRSRVLSYVIETSPARTAFTGELHEFMKTGSYGWAGPDWLTRLSGVANNPAALQGLKDSFKQFRADVTAVIGEDKRLLSKIALLAFASRVSACSLLGMDYATAHAEAVEDAKRMYDRLPAIYHDQYATKAMEVLAAYFGNPRNQEIWGCEEGAMLLAESANRALEAASLVPERVWSDFAERGWLVAANGQCKVNRTIKGGAKRWVYLIPNKIWANGGDPSEDGAVAFTEEVVEPTYEQRLASREALAALGEPTLG